MFKTNTFFFLFICFSISFNAQIFQQDFESSTFISDYISTVPNDGEFSAISSGSQVESSITNGALRLDKKEVGSAYFYRNLNPPLSSDPTFIQFKFDFEVTKNDPNHPDDRREIPFYFGPSFDSSGTSISTAYCRFGLGISETDGNFFLKVLDNGSTQSLDFSGKQTITFIANNSGDEQTYSAPDGNVESVGNDTWEIWVGTVKVFNDVPVKNPDLTLGAFKLQNNSFLPIATLDFDNFEYKDFLVDFTPPPPTQSLVHPHIWVSNADKQEILDNIANYSWANRMFTQLQNRQQNLKDTHVSNPESILNQIPAIPGDRTNHRERLNAAAESSFLYYLTGDEEYAQVASDVLHHYVKMISIQDPLTFEFYEPNFNHLIPPRELFPRVAMIYDFVQPFLSKSGTTVYDLESTSRVSFNFETSQKAFEVMADNVIKIGGNNSNHPVLELPGARYSVMCMEDDAVRGVFYDELLNGPANSKQPGVNWMLDRFSEEDRLWPESAGYAKFTHALFIQLMNIIDVYSPELAIIQNNKDLLESIFIYENFLYPNGATMAYGDIGRSFTDHAHIFRAVLKIAERKGYTDLKNRAATTLQKIYDAEGGYNPVIETQRLEWNNPLQLLWGVHIDDSVSNAGEPQYGTMKASHAGVVMQRNYVETNNEQYGLMYYTGGGTYVHAHATGLDFEIYGAGYVIGPDFGGASSGYGTPLHEEYAVSHAAHNTIIVNGETKRGIPSSGTWENIVDPIVLEASEPKTNADPIAENFSFSSQFLDDNINNVDQLRTNSIVRTSATTGYYVDVFRSVSNVTNNYHDYLFHGLGDEMIISKNGAPLDLINTPNRYQNDIGDSRKQPGWRWYTNAKTSELSNAAISAKFELQTTNDFLHVHVPGGVEKEYSSALAPPTQEVRNGYDNKDTQMFIMRKYGEAWNEPFVAIYEPSDKAESTVLSTKQIYSNNSLVGVEVISQVDGQVIRDVILSNTDNQGSLYLPDYEIVFKGRFAIVRTEIVNNKTNVSLYLGEGQELTFIDKTVTGDNDEKAYLEYQLDYEYEVPAEAITFTVEAIGESCVGKKNGKIHISSSESRSFKATVNGNDYDFTNTTSIENLDAGTYSLCISIEDDIFEQCYEVEIAEGMSLSGKIQVENNTADVTIKSGTAPFIVFKNGELIIETYQSNFSVAVNHGDDIEVQGKSACQGELAEHINLLENIKAYPNPSNGVFELFIPANILSIHVEVYNVQSQLVSSETYDVNAGVVNLNINENPKGVYFVKVNTEEPIFLKIIKN